MRLNSEWVMVGFLMLVTIIVIVIGLSFPAQSPSNIEIPSSVQKLTFHTEIFDCGDGLKDSIGCYWNNEIQIISSDNFPEGYGGFYQVMIHESYHASGNPNCIGNNTETCAYDFAKKQSYKYQ
jgi:hypothetical protein